MDTGSEVNLFSAGLLLPGAEMRSENSSLWAANGSEIYLMAKVRLEAQHGLRRFAVDFMVTPQVEFPILGEGCMQDLGLLCDHRLNEVVV